MTACRLLDDVIDVPRQQTELNVEVNRLANRIMPVELNKT